MIGNMNHTYSFSTSQRNSLSKSKIETALTQRNTEKTSFLVITCIFKTLQFQVNSGSTIRRQHIIFVEYFI